MDFEGISLNDTLLSEPTLLKDSVSIILRFRLHAVVFTADIRQMFLQINVHPEHRKFQQILFRFAPDQPLQTYTLNTVTFGLICSPYLAIRTLCKQTMKRIVVATEVLANGIYCPNIVSGGHK